MPRCIAPRCPQPTFAQTAFCEEHGKAPAGRRGGWLSAHRRRLAMAAATDALEASNVYPKLWVGSRPPVTARMPAFTMLVLCAAEYQPERMAFPGAVIHAPLHDHRPTASEVHVAAAAGHRVAIELQRGGRVLVTCHAGLNRSALVAALAVMQVCRMPAAEIVAMFRQRRSDHCLSNRYFVDFLNRCEAGRARVRGRQ